jgi:hypothetical protein
LSSEALISERPLDLASSSPVLKPLNGAAAEEDQQQQVEEEQGETLRQDEPRGGEDEGEDVLGARPC